MKIPRLLSVRRAIYLAVAAVLLAIFLKLFGAFAATGLVLVACLAGVYAAALTWAPDLFGEG